MIIYQITNTITKDFYIGKTKNAIETRFYHHKYNSIHKKSQAYLHRAIRKYGENNFIIERIDTANNLQELNKKEMFWIQKLSPKYNMTKGGDGGDVSQSPNYIIAQKNKNYKHSEKSKKKISEGNKKKKKPFSNEVKLKLSLMRKGKKMPPRTDMWRKKQSISQKNKKRNPFSEEHKNNLRLAWQKRKLNT